MSDRGLKVTDKRMFTPDGELREEYLRQRSSEDAPSEPETGEGATEPAPAGVSSAAPQSAPPPEAAPQAEEPPEEEPPPGAPRFSDLVRLLAENASVYLAEAQRGNPQTAQEHLELARLHIDLLGVLQSKTRGNLTGEEQAMLESVMYQLRAGYVGMGG
ncbi:MAG: DUF1844 domain-containing protein [Acidobacteriota bacterium]